MQSDMQSLMDEKNLSTGKRAVGMQCWEGGDHQGLSTQWDLCRSQASVPCS